MLAALPSCHKAFTQEEPPKITQPKAPDSIEVYFKKTLDVSGKAVFCASEAMYSVYVAEIKSFVAQCFSCPGWISGELNDSR